MLPAAILYSLMVYEKFESTIAYILIVFIVFIIYSLPYLFVLLSPAISLMKFIAISFFMVPILSVIISPKFFSEMIIRDLHMGNIVYPKLRVSKKACDYINSLDYGYKCENNIIYDNLTYFP